MKIEKGVTYWGLVGTRETNRKVIAIETRSSGTEYVNWISIKKSGDQGKRSWTRLDKFQGWVRGIYELE